MPVKVINDHQGNKTSLENFPVTLKFLFSFIIVKSIIATSFGFPNIWSFTIQLNRLQLETLGQGVKYVQS